MKPFNYLLIIAFSFSITNSALAIPLEQQSWANFADDSTPYDVTADIGGRTVRVQVSAGTTLFNAGETNVGDLVNQPSSFLTNPNNLSWFSVAGGVPEAYTISFTATNTLLNVGDAIAVFELNGDTPTGNASSITITSVTDINDAVILNPNFTTNFEEVTGDRTSLLSWNPGPNTITMDSPRSEVRSGALYLINNNGIGIRSITMSIDTPTLSDTSQESIRYGLAYNTVPVPEPSTYLILSSGIFLLLLIAKTRKRRVKSITNNG